MAAHTNGPVAYLWQVGFTRPFIVPLRALLKFDDSTSTGKADKAHARQSYATWTEDQYSHGASCKNVVSGFFCKRIQDSSNAWWINPQKVDTESFFSRPSNGGHADANVLVADDATLGTLSLPVSTLQPNTHVSPRTVRLHTP